MKQAPAEPVRFPRWTPAPQGLDLRHLRYLVAVADAGTLPVPRSSCSGPADPQPADPAAGTAHRRAVAGPRPGRGAVDRGGRRAADRRPGRAVPNWSRGQPGPAGRRAGPRPRLRVALPPGLPDSLAVPAACGLRSAAGTAGVALTWLDTPLDAEFYAVREHRADAALGWLTTLPRHAARPVGCHDPGTIRARGMDPPLAPGRPPRGYQPRRAGRHGRHPRATPRQHRDLRSVAGDPAGRGPAVRFTDPPLRHSLPVALAFAATAGRPAAVLTGPVAVADVPPGVVRLPSPRARVTWSGSASPAIR